MARTVLARAVTGTSVLGLLVFGLGGVAHADEATPSPSIGDLPTDPPDFGTDNPTTIPTGAAPSLPGETGPGDEGYSEPPDNFENVGSGSEPNKVDAQSGGLKLASGAKLAPPKVLDIKFVTENMGGDERREDSTEKTKFTLQAEVLFPKDSNKLNGKANAKIKEIAAEVEKQKGSEVNVYGFTDDLGSYEHGKKLSRARAATVQQRLAEELGSDVSFNVRGYSEDYPVADNKTEEGRKKNRRVEVSFPRQEG
ncbi:OmpA family protein [Streptomyces xiaopingdaonensis]|uniref:OmpA family protein n=1 Tax=Streptomyces xiaopingdaonensis TaxID=1565415 RepID=UPI0002F36661|nr:OmpA family protein [Streptomyces xiaopingdaonensis]